MSEAQHGLPVRSAPQFQAYLAARSQLKSDEQSLRADAQFKATLSPTARRACEIVDEIRDEELRTVWTPDVEETMATTKHEAVFPGMMFMQAKERIEATKLWHILHGMHLSTNMPLATAEARADAKLVFRKFFVLLGDAADTFPHGGRAGHEQHHGVNAIWVKFEKCFSVRLMRALKDDGINRVELRYGWPLNYCRDRQEEPEKDYTHFFQFVEEEVKRFQESEEGPGFWRVTLIWSSRRSIETPKLLEHMKHCIATKKKFPHLIAGFDLVGNEDRGRSLDDLLPELLWCTEECKSEGVHLPFFFHAKETLGDGGEIDQNLFDAILLGTRRIGHGYSLYKHPKLFEMVRERQILIESCAISNEVLRLCGSIMAHLLPALLAQGVRCSLNNDGPAILGQISTGVSHDFWRALQGWKNIGLAGRGNLAENSIRWAAFEDEDDTEWVLWALRELVPERDSRIISFESGGKNGKVSALG
ncbi:hypothetical protein PWT90_03070 [Aphanocladium album]|nr:hypothetical protein PWT90_03070 [Aphanocladium album]